MKILNIVFTAKTGPGSKMVDRVWHFDYLLKRIKSHAKSLYAFLRRPYNLHVIQFLCLYLHDKYHFNACKLWSRELVPDPGRWSRLLYFLPPNSVHPEVGSKMRSF